MQWQQDAEFGTESAVCNGSSRGSSLRGAATREQRGTTVRPIRGIAVKDEPELVGTVVVTLQEQQSSHWSQDFEERCRISRQKIRGS